MKIGILTFLHAFNYGAELQSFALQYKLRSLGYDVEVLDVYRPLDKEYKHTKNEKERFAPLYSYKNVSDIKSKFHKFVSSLCESFLTFFYQKYYKQRKIAFDEFHSRFTRVSERKYYNYLELYNYKMPYTHIIVGSDQVWNYTNPFSVEPYFLTFANNIKKISYAASIGHDQLPDVLEPLYKKWLIDFDKLSLRESQGVEIVKSITKRNDVVCTLDPTILLTKEEWMEAFSIKNTNGNPYIIMYLLSKSDFSIKIAKYISKKYGMDIKLITTDAFRLFKDRSIQYYCGVSPQEFVSLYANASFAITNSFHGTAFAVNFGIPFISTTRKTKRVNSRFINLLTKVKCIDRLMYESDCINYTAIDEIMSVKEMEISSIERERSFSLDFLQNALS